MNKYEARQAARDMRRAGSPNAGSFHNSKTGDWFVTDKYKEDGTPIPRTEAAKAPAKAKR